MTSRGRCASRVCERRASRVRDRRGGDRLGVGVRCGDFPFGERDRVLLPPDVPTLLGGSVRPRRSGDVMAAQVPSYDSDATCWSPDDRERRRVGHEQ
jgi:hypothetical protein